jgi:hypothetical protein
VPDANGNLEPMLAALQALRASGCPVVGQDETTVARMADVAVRRWRSSARRGVPQGDRAARELDLLKGLIGRFDPDPIYRIDRDWQCVVHALLPHLVEQG